MLQLSIHLILCCSFTILKAATVLHEASNVARMTALMSEARSLPVPRVMA